MPETIENPIPQHMVESKIREYQSDRPWPVVCICGSMRFYNEMLISAERLTLHGHIVLMPQVRKDAAMSAGNKGVQRDIAQALPDGIDLAIFLDAMHREKIDMAERVLVVTNLQQYLGDSTKAEVMYAIEHGKDISFDRYPVSLPDKGD
jgi:hypothetical protein